ncbi:glycosyltransferase [Mycobacterium sp. AMU20-3851]|uniref:glycosyltransferase n=1 Tax=Mycobacterium sp. AMU20-3851 TaxID=3122055 RepID=UPI00375411ED
MTDRLRIAVIASNRFPIRQPFAGGLESHVWHLARSLADRGHDVSLFAGNGSEVAPGCRTLAVRQLLLSEAATRDISMPGEAFMHDHHAYLSVMLELARSGSADFDVVHNHSLHHLPVAMAPMLAVPMLTTVHTPPTPWLESALTATAGEGTRLAAVSRHTARSWAHITPDIEVVPNGIDTAHWALGHGGENLIWFGRITPEKGTHLAIAAARAAGVPLVLAGPVSDPAYFAESVEPHLGGQVRYAGHLTHDELLNLVGASSAALVTPMWDEPYGLVVAEAMSCGTPVVAFDRGGIRELLAPQAGRLVAPGDADAMATAIPEVLGLDRRAVRQHAKDRCSADAMLNTYLALYQQMITGTGGSDDDRLLRAPSRIRPSGAGDEHLRTAQPPGHGADQSAGTGTESVHRRCPASA